MLLLQTHFWCQIHLCHPVSLGEDGLRPLPEGLALLLPLPGVGDDVLLHLRRHNGLGQRQERHQATRVVRSLTAEVLVPFGVQGSAKRWFPGCVNAAGKARQKW